MFYLHIFVLIFLKKVNNYNDEIPASNRLITLI